MESAVAVVAVTLPKDVEPEQASEDAKAAAEAATSEPTVSCFIFVWHFCLTG